MAKNSLLMALLLICTISHQLYNVEKIFLQNYAKISHLTLSEASQQKSLDAEFAEFSQLLQNEQYRNFKADPQLSSQILLKRENNWNQSIYLHVKQQAQMIIEVKVTHKQDIFQNQSIQLHLISLKKSTVIYSCKVKNIKIIKTQVDPDLYEVRVSYKWKSRDGVQDRNQQISKHIKIDADIINTVKTNQSVDIVDQKKANQRLKQIKTRTDKIFVDSLQIWEQVQNHQHQQFMNQQGIYLRAYMQIIGVFIINVIQLMALKKTLKIQSLV